MHKADEALTGQQRISQLADRLIARNAAIDQLDQAVAARPQAWVVRHHDEGGAALGVDAAQQRKHAV